MFGVAFCAFLAGRRIQTVRGVQSTMCVQARSNFSMTLKTLQCGLSTKLVTGGAVSGAFQCFVRAGERAGGNLGMGIARCKNTEQCQQCSIKPVAS